MNELINASKRSKFEYVKIKRAAIRDVGIVAKVSLKTPIHTPATFSFVWYCRNRRKDPDNIMSGQKYVFDGLQECGLLENDGWKEIAGITHEFRVDKHNPRVEITIHEGLSA